jgi:phosphate transport system permease protein
VVATPRLSVYTQVTLLRGVAGVSASAVIMALVAAAILAYILGRARGLALQSAGSGTVVHSRAFYHGAYLALWTLLGALVATIAWSIIAPQVINRQIAAELPPRFQSLAKAERDFVSSRINSIAQGLGRLSSDELRTVERVRVGVSPPEAALSVLQSKGVVLGAAPEPYIITAAYDKATMTARSNWLMTGLAAVLAVLGFGWAFSRIRPELRARNAVEGVILAALMVASGVAILTTAGIIISVLFETLHFFQYVRPTEFLFGTVWDPRFAAAGATASASGGQFGLLPLLWGTLFISFVAMMVAVPIGLLSALYMAEYASPRVRDALKPILEILAGIPTIVYGFFALTTFGPMLRDFGAVFGLNIAASSVLSAGFVMGIMIIPYVSSLADDIITAVPQSLRDGAYALGATKSETIKQVVFPAALPGIVGAVLLAVSRAIGETMIVVLAAGIAAKLTVNPFEAVTTMTVKIVSQLTGDLEFTSPQTLVAFALGLSLFILTLLLNIYALYIVRKYREQYE